MRKNCLGGKTNDEKWGQTPIVRNQAKILLSFSLSLVPRLPFSREDLNLTMQQGARDHFSPVRCGGSELIKGSIFLQPAAGVGRMRSAKKKLRVSVVVNKVLHHKKVELERRVSDSYDLHGMRRIRCDDPKCFNLDNLDACEMRRMAMNVGWDLRSADLQKLRALFRSWARRNHDHEKLRYIREKP